MHLFRSLLSFSSCAHYVRSCCNSISHRPVLRCCRNVLGRNWSCVGYSVCCVALRAFILMCFVLMKLRIARWTFRKAVMAAKTASFPISSLRGFALTCAAVAPLYTTVFYHFKSSKLDWSCFKTCFANFRISGYPKFFIVFLVASNPVAQARATLLCFLRLPFVI